MMNVENVRGVMGNKRGRKRKCMVGEREGVD